jgi:hypothetical protein
MRGNWESLLARTIITTEPLPSDDWVINIQAHGHTERSILVPLFRLSSVRGIYRHIESKMISKTSFYIFQNKRNGLK